MAGKHRSRRKNVQKFAKRATAFSAATVTATALIGVTPPPEADAATATLSNADAELLAAINPWPSPDQIPDLTGGLGTFGYDLSQTVIDLVLRAVVENVNLSALAQAAGLDLPSLVESLLGDPDFLLNDVLGGVLGAIPIDLTPALDELVGTLLTDTVLVPVMQLLGITDANGVTDLLQLLGLVGLDLSDPLNLAGLDIPGLNVITASPIFTALKLLGVDLGWVPSLPNSVAGEINGTPYLEVGAVGLLDTLFERLVDSGLDPLGLLGPLQGIIDDLLGDVLPDVVDLRVPVSVGIGMGAFALATGYDQVLADLANQPGGANYDGLSPLLGSFTILPMLLGFNPARPNGGFLARLYPLAGLFGIDTVNPETEASSSCDNLLCVPILGTGLTLGGANLLPLLIDIGVQYHPTSDFAAWPNPVSLANNLMAGVLPTYMLRGLTLDTVTDQVTTQLADILAGVANGDPLALNLYLTIPSATLPLLEPLYLLSDVISLASLGMLAVNPVSGLANALAPALTALTNLGYTDVVRNPDGTYTRTLTEGGDPTAFFSFPSGINPLQVVPDVLNLLVQGFQKEFFSGNPTPATPNAILNLLEFLTGGDLLSGLPLGDLGGLVQDVVGGLTGGLFGGLNLPAVNPLAATQEATTFADPAGVPTAGARMLSMSTDKPLGDESQGDTKDSDVIEPVTEDGTEEEPTEPPTEEQPIDEEDLGEEDLGEDGLGEEDLGEDGLGEDGLGEDGLGEEGLGEDGLGEDGLGDEDLGDDLDTSLTSPEGAGNKFSPKKNEAENTKSQNGDTDTDDTDEKAAEAEGSDNAA